MKHTQWDAVSNICRFSLS